MKNTNGADAPCENYKSDDQHRQNQCSRVKTMTPDSRRPNATLSSQYRSRFALRTYTAVLAVTAFALFLGRDLAWTLAQWIGLCIWLPSAVLWTSARLQLGASFSAKAEARTLVTRGLYSRVQNPIYLFAGLLLCGLIVFLERPWYLLIFCVIIPVQLLRIRRERQVLTTAFQEDYLQYRKNTWF